MHAFEVKGRLRLCQLKISLVVNAKSTRLRAFCASLVLGNIFFLIIDFFIVDIFSGQLTCVTFGFILMG